MIKDPNRFLKSDVGRKMLRDLGGVQIDAESPRLNVGRRSIEEFYRQGDDSIKAIIQEVKLMKKGWDIELSANPSGLVHIYHGPTDINSPVSNAHRNAKTIPGAHLEIFEGETNLLATKNLKKIFEVLK